MSEHPYLLDLFSGNHLPIEDIRVIIRYTRDCAVCLLNICSDSNRAQAQESDLCCWEIKRDDEGYNWISEKNNSQGSLMPNRSSDEKMRRISIANSAYNYTKNDEHCLQPTDINNNSNNKAESSDESNTTSHSDCNIRPSNNVQCMVNDIEITGPTRIYDGAIIQIGENLFRFTCKDKRSMLSWRLCKEDRNSCAHDVYSSSTEISKRSYSIISDLASSYICHELMLNTKSSMTAQFVDQLYRIFEENEECWQMLMHFVQTYTSCGGGDTVDEAVITLLVNLLRSSLDPVSHNIIWLQLLATFCSSYKQVGSFIKEQGVSAVLGSMAAHRACRQLQQAALNIIARVAKHISPKDLLEIKFPLGENCVDLVVECIQTHANSLQLCHAAFTALHNLTITVCNLLLTYYNRNNNTFKRNEERLDIKENTKWSTLNYRHLVRVANTLQVQVVPTMQCCQLRHINDNNLFICLQNIDAHLSYLMLHLKDDMSNSPISSYIHLKSLISYRSGKTDEKGGPNTDKLSDLGLPSEDGEWWV